MCHTAYWKKYQDANAGKLEDGKVQKVLRWVLIDDLVLYTANKAVMNHELCLQWRATFHHFNPKSEEVINIDNYITEKSVLDLTKIRSD